MIGRTRGLYMRVDGFKRADKRTSPKKRSLTPAAFVRLLFMAKRFNIGIFFILLAAVSFKMCMPQVDMQCIPCMTGETSEVQGVITKVEVSSYGAKGYNDYNIYYTYNVNGKVYTGMAADSGKGLGYLENHAVVVDYSVKCYSCSCARDMECLAESALFAVVTGAVLILIGLLWLLSGIRGISGAAAVLQYGELVQGTVTSISEEIKSNPFNFAGVAARHSKIRVYKVNCSFNSVDGKKMKCIVFAKNKDVINSGDPVTVIYDPEITANALVAEALPKLINTRPELAL
jgi:hypothetical protein